jgi:hypothetical protein
MTDKAPERIWATVNGASTTIGIGPDGLACPGPRQLIGGWRQFFRHSGEVEYVRADLADAPPTLAEAMTVPEVRALVEALEWIKRRKPSNIRPDGGMDMPHREHGEAAYDMWACADAALAKLKGPTP